MPFEKELQFFKPETEKISEKEKDVESFEFRHEEERERQEMNRIENLEKHSEKLGGLLQLIDKYTFPEKPLPVKIGRGIEIKDKTIEKIGEAAHRRKFYEVNREIDREDLRDSYDLEKLTEIAMHEVRHRVQWNSPKMEILNPENLKNFKDIKNFEKEYESLEKSGKEFYELLPEKFKKDKDYVRREFDAETIERLAFILREKGVSLSEISNKVISQDAKTIPQNTESLLERKPEKRFTLSKEQFAQERIEAIKDVVKESKQKYPEVLSLCMFGSMVTGEARPESDIDGYLFVDAEAVAKKTGRDQTDILEKAEPQRNILEHFKEDKELKIPNYSQDIRGGLKEKLNLSDKQVEHIRERPISKYIIDQHLEDLLEQVQKVKDYEGDFRQWEAVEPPPLKKGEDLEKHLEKLTAYDKQKPEHPGLPDPSLNLSAMFHLEVGGGIRDYRKYLVDQLTGSGENGEEAWREIIDKTEKLEQYLTISEKRYPRTLKEAIKIYG